MFPQFNSGINYFGNGTMQRQMTPPQPQGLLSPQGNPMQGTMPSQAQGMPMAGQNSFAGNNSLAQGGDPNAARAMMQQLGPGPSNPLPPIFGAAQGQATSNPYAQNSMMGGNYSQFQGPSQASANPYMNSMGNPYSQNYGGGYNQAAGAPMQNSFQGPMQASANPYAQNYGGGMNSANQLPAGYNPYDRSSMFATTTPYSGPPAAQNYGTGMNSLAGAPSTMTSGQQPYWQQYTGLGGQ